MSADDISAAHPPPPLLLTMTPSLDVILRAVGYGMVLPATVAMVGLLVGWRVRGGAKIAIVAGLFAGYVALAATQQIRWGFLKPVDPSDWLPALTLLAFLASVPAEFPSLQRFVGWPACLGVAVTTGWVLVWAESAIEPVNAWWAVGIAAAVIVLWRALDHAARHWPGFVMPSLLAVVLLVTAAICEMSGNLTFAHIAGIVAAVLAGGAVAAGLQPQLPLLRAAVPAVAVMLPGLLFVSFWNNFGEVPSTSYLLVLAAPVSLSVAVQFTYRD